MAMVRARLVKVLSAAQTLNQEPVQNSFTNTRHATFLASITPISP